MTYLQFVCHQLIRMLAVRLTQVLMQEDTMTDGQAAIHAIHQEEEQPCNVTRSHNQLTDGKQHDESNAHTTHITSETFRLTTLTEVEYAEYEHREDDHR